MKKETKKYTKETGVKIIRAFGIGLAILMTAGCGTDTAPTTAKMQRDAVENIKYVKDGRSGICYSLLTSMGAYGYRTTSHTAVPCANVEHLIDK